MYFLTLRQICGHTVVLKAAFIYGHIMQIFSKSEPGLEEGEKDHNITSIFRTLLSILICEKK